MSLTAEQNERVVQLVCGIIGAAIRLVVVYDKDPTKKKPAAILIVGTFLAGAACSVFGTPYIDSVLPGHSPERSRLLCLVMGLLGITLCNVLIVVFDRRGESMLERYLKKSIDNNTNGNNGTKEEGQKS